MDIQLIVAALSFGTAVIGLTTALVGRRREVVHRHVNGAPSSGGLTPVGWVGRILLVGGVVVCLGGLLGYFQASLKADRPVPAARPADRLEPAGRPADQLLAGPQSGTLVLNPADPIPWKGAGVNLRDVVVEVTLFVPDAPAGANWVQSLWFRRATGSPRGWCVSINREGRWGTGGFNDSGAWIAGNPVEQDIPAGLLAGERGARNQLRVELNGNRGRLLINGRLVSDFDASEVMSEGDVAVGFNVLRREAMTRPVECHYENLRVYSAP